MQYHRDISVVCIEHANCNILQLLLPVPCSFKKYHFTSCYLAAKHANDTSAPLGTFHTRLYAGQHSSCSNLQLRPVKWSPTQALKKLIWCFLHSYLPMTTPQTSFFFQYGLVLLSLLTSDVWTGWKHVFTHVKSLGRHCFQWSVNHVNTELPAIAKKKSWATCGKKFATWRPPEVFYIQNDASDSWSDMSTVSGCLRRFDMASLLFECCCRSQFCRSEGSKIAVQPCCSEITRAKKQTHIVSQDESQQCANGCNQTCNMWILCNPSSHPKGHRKLHSGQVIRKRDCTKLVSCVCTTCHPISICGNWCR